MLYSMNSHPLIDFQTSIHYRPHSEGMGKVRFSQASVRQHLWEWGRGWVPPSGQLGGVPFPGQDKVLPHPRSEWGGYPLQRSGWGVLLPRSGQGEYPIPGQNGGYPLPRSGLGGYPIPGQNGRYPFPGQDGGYPLPRSGWGYLRYPPSAGWGTLLWSELSICNKPKPLGSFTLSYTYIHVCFKALSLAYVKHKKEQKFCVQLSAFIHDSTCSS